MWQHEGTFPAGPSGFGGNKGLCILAGIFNRVEHPQMVANLIQFATNHYILVAIFVVLLVLLLINEIRRGGQSLSNGQLTALVNADQAVNRVNGGGWARPASDLLFAGSNKAGTTIPGPVAINSTNGDDVASEAYPHPIYGTEGTSQPFGFHLTGVNTLFADGSVKLIDEAIDITVFSALITRDKAEKVSDGAF